MEQLSRPFVQHQIGLLAFVSLQLLIVLSNLWALRRLHDARHSQRQPRVSVLVPARNEEKNIGPCVESLLSQSYPDYQVIVLDDNSTDGTGAVLSSLSSEYEELQVINGQSLPDGWLGKNWACHQLAQHAEGELLMFVDADTRHHSESISSAVSVLMADNADLLSAIPRQETVTWAERLVIPIIPWSIVSLIPLAIAYRVRLPVLSAAIGQFILFRRSAYEQIGGHSAVRESPVEDFALARRTKAAGLRWRLVDGTNRVECRMYTSGREVVQGVSRTLFAVFRGSIPFYLFAWLWLSIAYLEPLGVLGIRLAGHPVSTLSLGLSAASVLISLTVWLITYRRFRVPSYLAVLYPFTILALGAIAARSLFIALTGRGTWKGRPVVAGR
jgi:chlorobactene glucosyltransferase